MKVLFLVPDLKVGGVTTIVRNIESDLKERGHEAQIISLRGESVENLAMSRKTDLIRALFKFNSIISKYKPDIIHSHTVFPHIIALLYKIFFNRKICIVTTEHGSFQKAHKKNIVFKLLKYLLPYSNKVTFVSNFSSQSYIENRIVDAEKVKVIHNGINKKLKKNELPIQDNNIFKFCFIGRFSYEKNIKLLLDAFSQLKKSYIGKEISLYLIGDGEEKQRMEDYCLAKNIDNVNFWGFRSDIDDILSQMDCLVLSSLTEGLPTVIIEAFAQKVLVVSTGCGGVKEIIEDINFIAHNNDINSLVEKMNFVLDMDKSASDVVKNKNYYNYKLKFSSEVMMKAYESLYNEVLNVS